MSNMLAAVVPKSDQLNYDDLIGGQTKTIKITGVTVKPGEQPTTIFYEGDNGKPYKPCKSMARVLIHCWGPDGNKYIGRSLTLYGDPNVIFGAGKVGGIRISHISDISETVTMALTATRANRKPYTVKPLVVAAEPSLQDWVSEIKAAATLDDLQHKFTEAQKIFKDTTKRVDLIAAKDARKAELTATQGDA